MLDVYRRIIRSPGAPIITLGGLLCLSTIALFLTDLQTRYWDRIAAAKIEARSFANILAEHTALTFEDVDRALHRAEAIRETYMSGKTPDVAQANSALRQVQKSSSVLVAIGWTDASGEVVAHSYDKRLPRNNISGMSHFIAQRDSASDELFIAPPYRSAVSSKWFTAASRRLSNPDGSFAGIVTAPIDQAYFTKLYRSIDLGSDGSVLLMHRNGQLLAREPVLEAAIGRSFENAPLLAEHLPKSESGSYESVSVVDGVHRIAAYKAVHGLPLVVLVSFGRSDVLAPWYWHLYTFGLLVLAITIVILFGTIALVRQTNSLAARRTALARTNSRFDAALSNMPHGLSMFDADEKLLVSNSCYREMYNLTDEQAKPGTPLSAILRDFASRPEEIDFRPDSFSQGAKQRTPHTLRLADGRTILIVRTPMKDGGWVATHEDITEKQLAETTLLAKAAELKQANERFDVAISNMSQGLCLFDAGKNLVISNRRYQEMYGLPDELVIPGTSLQKILQFYADRGETGTLTVNQYTQVMPAEAENIYELADGRKIFIQRQPLLDGGWVATHTDITEQKRAERQLAEKAEELKRINARFDAALNNMSQGLCMFDAEQKIVVSNARYGEIYHLNLDQIKPGTSLRQILEYRKEKGTHFGVSPDVYVSANVKQASEVQELADGRSIAIARHPMVNGGWLTTHEDISQRARNEKRIAFLAQHDLLTGLANRALFSEKLGDAAKRFQRQGSPFTVLMLDLDKFKHVNDTLGHPAGDKLLVEVARRLKSSLRDTDMVARLGGDEFAIIQEDEINQSEAAIGLALRIIGLIEQPIDIDGHRVSVGTSIGIAFAPEHGDNAEAMMQKADLALYAAKSGGRNDFRVFGPELAEAADLQKSLESELREAISRNELELHYQPVIDVRVGAVSGVEAFVRWHHPSKGMLAPDQFLPLAESTGLMTPIGEWILQQACLDAATWPAHVRVAVNISVAQFTKGNLFDIILCALIESGLSPDRLELEIEDTVLLERQQTAHLLAIRQLKNLGVSVVLDNCRAGYSAASYLTNFPFDKIKIDRSIVQGFVSRRDCKAAIASVLALAHGLDITTAAKGVESHQQFEALIDAGVDFAQGYLFGEPVPHSELNLKSVFLLSKNVA
jgi:diguanylate cyclase (GGDEF)-like protein